MSNLQSVPAENSPWQLSADVQARLDVIWYFLEMCRLTKHLLFWAVRAEELLDGIQEKIPTFQGLKFSDTDLLDFGQCVDQNRQRQFAFLFGVDEVSHSSVYPTG